jgi:predicted DCC family thiol-disulfide oxidoreductase YuxK
MLCNWTVRFIIRHDKNEVFWFSTLQSNFAKKHLLHMNGQDIISDHIIFQDGDHLYIKSDAVLKILKEISGFWKPFYFLILIPRPLRDWLYGLIARYRYSLFGKMNRCMIPAKELKSRFIE